MTPKDLNDDAFHIRALEKEIADRDRRLAAQQSMLDGIFKSRSWRWTEALRSIAFKIRGLTGSRNGVPQGRSGTNVGAPTRVTLDGQDMSRAVKDGFAKASKTVLEEFLASKARLAIPHAETPAISVILVVHNRAELTLPCLRSLAEPQGVPFELIVVDNDSTDETTALFGRVDGARLFRNSKNVYFIRAVNQGAEHARGRYLLLVNNDAILLPGTLESLMSTIESSDDIGAVGGKIVSLDGRLQEAGNIIWKNGTCQGYGRGDDPLAPPYMFQRDVDYCSGALLLTRKNLFDQFGGFDEAFSPAYYEETDYCIRLWDAGYRIVFDPAACILHYEFASRSREEASELQIEKRKLFVRRHEERLKAHRTKSDANILLSRTARAPEKRILFIDDRVPHPHLGSGFPRAHRILTRLVEWNSFVTMFPTAVISEEWSSVYSDISRKVEVMLHCGPSGLEAFLNDRRGFYDVILVSRPHNMEKLAPIVERNPEWFFQTKIIYDAEAIFAARQSRKQELFGTSAESGIHEDLLAEEIGLARAASAVLSVSEADAKAFREEGVRMVHVLGHALQVEPTTEGFEDRSGLLFVGAVYEDDSPNGDSVIWFAEEILPKIHAVLGNVQVTLVGINKSKRIRAMASERVRVLGTRKDLQRLYAINRVFIAPTRFSAGIPHKIHEAAAFGLPVVATSLLADQLDWTPGEELLVGNTADDFARRCVELYTDTVVWEKVRRRALERVATDCSPGTFDQTLRDVFALT